jgi:hypothetical protein
VLDRLTAMQTFVRVAATGSFSAAARTLGPHEGLHGGQPVEHGGDLTPWA